MNVEFGEGRVEVEKRLCVLAPGHMRVAAIVTNASSWAAENITHLTAKVSERDISNLVVPHVGSGELCAHWLTCA